MGEVLERYPEVKKYVIPELLFSVSQEMYRNNLIEIQEYDGIENKCEYLLGTKEFVAECFVMSGRERKALFVLIEKIKCKVDDDLKKDVDTLRSILFN